VGTAQPEPATGTVRHHHNGIGSARWCPSTSDSALVVHRQGAAANQPISRALLVSIVNAGNLT